MAKQSFFYDGADGEGPSRESSHPVFVEHFTHDFYYDCLDDFTPFGNDTGADMLGLLEEFYQNGGVKKNIVNWLFETIDGFGFKYASESLAPAVAEETIDFLEKEDPQFLLCMDQAIMAAVFGQCKISGRIQSDLLQLGVTAIQRQKMVLERAAVPPQISRLAYDPETLAALTDEYAGSAQDWRMRLDEMQEDLARFANSIVS